MNYNEIVGTICRVSGELKATGQEQYYEMLRDSIIALDDLRDKIQCEIDKIQRLLVGADSED